MLPPESLIYKKQKPRCNYHFLFQPDANPSTHTVHSDAVCMPHRQDGHETPVWKAGKPEEPGSVMLTSDRVRV